MKSPLGGKISRSGPLTRKALLGRVCNRIFRGSRFIQAASPSSLSRPAESDGERACSASLHLVDKPVILERGESGMFCRVESHGKPRFRTVGRIGEQPASTPADRPAEQLFSGILGETKLLEKGTYMKRNKLRELLKTIFFPAWLFMVDLLPRKWHVTVDHIRVFGKLPNLKHPRTFNEKIAYRKLYDRDSRMPPLVDKIIAKEKMAARFGDGFIIPTLATFESPIDIDYDALPYPCVMKTNHASAANVFLMNRPADAKDEEMIRRQLREYLRMDFHAASEEWAYSKVRRRLLVEPFIESGEHGLVDYKFHTFNGRAFAIQVDLDRYTGHRRTIRDSNWNEMPVEYTFPRPSYAISRPDNLDKMLRYAEQIGEDFSYVRVDLYEISGCVKFGEMTFYPGAGLERLSPEFDELLGMQWSIPERN